MAATGKTPILLYGSTTATNAPVAANLTNSSDGCEIAINVADKNLFFKDSTNVVNTVPIRQSSASSNGWLSSTDWSTFNNKQPAGSYALTTGTLAQFAATTSAQLAGVISDETGTGSLVFNTTPVIQDLTAYRYVVNVPAAGYFTSSKYNSQGVTWATDPTLPSYILNGTSTQRPEISWYRGTRTYPEFSIRQHTTNDTGGEVYAGPGTSAPTKVAEIKATGWTLMGNVTVSTGNLVIGTSGKGIDFSATAAGIIWRTGVGSPEGVVTAAVGSLYTRSDGGANTTLYVKQSGTGNTGWAAK